MIKMNRFLVVTDFQVKFFTKCFISIACSIFLSLLKYVICLSGHQADKQTSLQLILLLGEYLL